MSLNEYSRGLLRQIPDVGQVQVTLAKEPTFGPALIENPRLSETAWCALWPIHRKLLDSAVLLVSRPLSEAQKTLVLSTEKRAKVLVHFMDANPPTTRTEAEAILARSSGQQVLAALLAHLQEANADDALVDQVGSQLTGMARLTWAAGLPADRLSDEDVLDILNTMPDWWGSSKSYGRRAAALRQLFDGRPSILDAAVHSAADESVVTTVAGCRHLASAETQARILGLDPTTHAVVGMLQGSKYAHLALANNPRAHQFVLDALATSHDGEVSESVSRRRSAGKPTVECAFEDVADQMVLGWLIKRAAPFWSSYSQETSPGKPFELAALAVNTHLGGEQATQVAQALNSNVVEDALGTERIARLLDTLRANYPDLDPALVDTTTATTSVDAVGGSVDGSYSPLSDEDMERALEFMREDPAHRVLDPRRYQADPSRDVLDRLLIEQLGEDPRAWELLVKLVADHFSEPLGNLAATCRRLASVHATDTEDAPVS